MNDDSAAKAADIMARAAAGQSVAPARQLERGINAMAERARVVTSGMTKNFRQVRCDACGKQMPMTLYEKAIPDTGEVEQYMRCPHCDVEFLTLRMTAQGVQLREELRNLVKQGRRGSGRFRRVLAAYQRNVTVLKGKRRQGKPGGKA